MKKLLLALLLLTGCNSNPAPSDVPEESTIPQETTYLGAPDKVGGGITVYPYETFIENPDYDIGDAYNYYDENSEFPPDLKMNVTESYPHFNPLKLLEEDPSALLANFASYNYDTKEWINKLPLEDLKELQSIALELETPASGEEASVEEIAQLSNEDWQEPIVFFTNLEKIKPLAELNFISASDYAYHYYEDRGTDERGCKGFEDRSYTPFILQKDAEGNLLGFRTSFSSTSIICGPGGAGAGTYLDLLVQLDEQGRLQRITGIYPERDELNEGPIFADYTFYYANLETSTDYKVRFIASQYNSNQMILSQINYTYTYPFDSESWYWY